MPPGALLLVHLVEERPVGFQFARSRVSWPLHITLVPWFNGVPVKELQSQLADQLKGYSGFTATIGEATTFGEAHDIPVNLMVEQERLRKLHLYLMHVVEAAGGKLVAQKQWIGRAYKAHITQHGIADRQPGETIPVTSVTLAELVDYTHCKLLATFALQGSEL